MTSDLFWRQVTFYAGVPLVLGIAFGLTRAGMLAPALPKPVSLVYWITLLAVLWTLMDVSTRVVARATRRWVPPLWAVLAMGGFLETILATPYLGLHQRFFTSFLPADTHFVPYVTGAVWDNLFAIPRWQSQNAYSIVLWVTVNYFFDRFVGLRRYHAPRASTEQTLSADNGTQDVKASAAPTGEDASLPERSYAGLLDRLPVAIRGPVIALSAEDHYVRVTTPRGSALVYGRVTTLAAAMPPNWGLRVHRSHWVCRTAVEKLRRRDGKYHVVLAGGVEVPVSARYSEVVRGLGIQ